MGSERVDKRAARVRRLFQKEGIEVGDSRLVGRGMARTARKALIVVPLVPFVVVSAVSDLVDLKWYAYLLLMFAAVGVLLAVASRVGWLASTYVLVGTDSVAIWRARSPRLQAVQLERFPRRLVHLRLERQTLLFEGDQREAELKLTGFCFYDPDGSRASDDDLARNGIELPGPPEYLYPPRSA